MEAINLVANTPPAKKKDEHGRPPTFDCYLGSLFLALRKEHHFHNPMLETNIFHSFSNSSNFYPLISNLNLHYAGLFIL